MSLLQKFDSDSYGSLTIHKDREGREFFRAIDVCYALKHSNPSQAISRLVDPDYVVKIDDGTNRSGGVNYLSEPGLYQLIFASKSIGAKKFQRWVFEEILPKLRASGGYIMPSATSDQLTALQDEIKELEARNQRLLTGGALVEYTVKHIHSKLKIDQSLRAFSTLISALFHGDLVIPNDLICSSVTFKFGQTLILNGRPSHNYKDFIEASLFGHEWVSLIAFLNRFTDLECDSYQWENFQTFVSIA